MKLKTIYCVIVSLEQLNSNEKSYSQLGKKSNVVANINNIIIYAKKIIYVNMSFRFSPGLSELLLKYLHEYKIIMEGKTIDFNSDKPSQYAFVRKRFGEDDEGMIEVFGPAEYTRFVVTEDVEEKKKQRTLYSEGKKLIERGYKRVQEKVKKIRQSFSDVVSKGGLSSGSPKVILANYDLLLQIYGGSASITPLEFGVSTDDTNTESFSTDTDEPGYENLNNDHNNGDSELTHALSSDIESNEVIGEGNDSANGSNKGKRKVATPAIPNLIDAKRKHMEKTLSAAQRDKILMNDAKEDMNTRKQLIEVMKEGNRDFASAISKVSDSMSEVAGHFCKLLNVFPRTNVHHLPTISPYINICQLQLPFKLHEIFQIIHSSRANL